MAETGLYYHKLNLYVHIPTGPGYQDLFYHRNKSCYQYSPIFLIF